MTSDSTGWPDGVNPEIALCPATPGECCPAVSSFGMGRYDTKNPPEPLPNSGRESIKFRDGRKCCRWSPELSLARDEIDRPDILVDRGARGCRRRRPPGSDLHRHLD